MNQLFVNIKVDREERPDVDSIYMEAVQAMTGRGGWPMTVWMTSDGRPFYAGTYFPRDRHVGMPSFREVMRAVSAAWHSDRDNVNMQADQLVEAISQDIPSGSLPRAEQLDRAAASVLGVFDATFGGFGGAPKFPQTPVLEFLLRSRGVDAAIDEAISVSLHRMADGGIHDHLGGGFARYSVDHRWLVPHFEKMLYDNAQLARIYLWAGIELDEPRFLDVTNSTLHYLTRDLRHRDGGFFSAEDADSEGVEGKFYVWDRDEFDEILGGDAEAAARYFDVSSAGNFEGTNILNLLQGRDAPPNLGSIRARLLDHRSKRVRPGLDDKVVAAWNGLAIRAFAEAGAALGSEEHLATATRAAEFVLGHLFPDGELMRSWREGETSVPGFVDDYASLALGLFSLYQATGDPQWFQAAELLVDGLGRFERLNGGFYTTSDGADNLIKRPRDITDNPSPSGNALAAEALLVSSLLSGDSNRRDRALAALSASGRLADRYPSMIGHHLAVARSVDIGTKEVAVLGQDRRNLTRVFWDRFRPHAVLAQSADASEAIPLLAGRPADASNPIAYVCEGFVCNLPTSDPMELARQLEIAGT